MHVRRYNRAECLVKGFKVSRGGAACFRRRALVSKKRVGRNARMIFETINKNEKSVHTDV